jgi:hypothetical protein
LGAALVVAWIVAPKTAIQIAPPLTPEIVAEENPLT